VEDWPLIWLAEHADWPWFWMLVLALILIVFGAATTKENNRESAYRRDTRCG